MFMYNSTHGPRYLNPTKGKTKKTKNSKGNEQSCSVTLYYSKYNAFHASSVQGVVLSDIITLGTSSRTTFAGVYQVSTSYQNFQV